MFDSDRIKVLGKRFVNFARPKPRKIPLTVDQVLSNSQCKSAVDQVSHILYNSSATQELAWKGMPLLKAPSDLWMLVDLLQKVKPSLVIETGTHHGGSATFFADMARALEIDTQIITVDINPKWSIDPVSKNIVSIRGLSTEPQVVNEVKKLAGDRQKTRSGHVIVALDSDHSKENVLNELLAYHPLVTVGSYLIVEDTNINGHPSFPSHGPGPFEAVQEFLSSHGDQFETDSHCERFLITMNPSGWLKRKA